MSDDAIATLAAENATLKSLLMEFMAMKDLSTMPMPSPSTNAPDRCVMVTEAWLAKVRNALGERCGLPWERR